MTISLKDKDFENEELLEKVMDALNKAEKLCKKYGRDCEFGISEKWWELYAKVYKSNNRYSQQISLEFDYKTNTIYSRLGTTSYGPLSTEEYNNFVDECIDASNLNKELLDILSPIEILMQSR